MNPPSKARGWQIFLGNYLTLRISDTAGTHPFTVFAGFCATSVAALSIIRSCLAEEQSSHAADRRLPMRNQNGIFLLLIGALFLAGCGGNAPAPSSLAIWSLLCPQSDLGGITTGPDGSLWFTETTRNQIGRITPGILRSFPAPDDRDWPDGDYRWTRRQPLVHGVLRCG